MSYTEAITLAIAVLGAALGLINTWHSMDKDRVKLRVVPKQAIPFGNIDERYTFCVEVINRSSFALTISEVGVLFEETGSRGSFSQPMLLDNKPWPRRLEPRESVTAYAMNPAMQTNKTIRCAYVKTDCGETRTGTSGALKGIIADAARRRSA